MGKSVTLKSVLVHFGFSTQPSEVREDDEDDDLRMMCH